MAARLTKADTKLLRSYLKALDELSGREPERLPDEVWDEVMQHVREHGEIPAARRGQVSERVFTDPATGETITGYLDTVWETWNEEVVKLHTKYRETVRKALMYALETGDGDTTPDVAELLEALISGLESSKTATEGGAGDLLTRAYLPMLNGSLNSDFMQIATKGMEADTFTKTATFTTSDGHKFSIENFDKLQASLGTPARKLFDTAVMYLTDTNFYRARAKNITPTVEIPLVEYGEACGYELTARVMETDEEQKKENERARQRLKDFKKDVRANLTDLSSVLWSGEETKGRNRGDYREMRIISSHSITKGVIRINFDIDAAAYLVNSYVMQYPTALLAIDNRRANAYVIGRKLAFHNSNDQNRAGGTDCTLSVRSLLAVAPDITTYEELKARGQRNWKDKIKRPLEAALDEVLAVGVISRWEYRDPKSGETYTAEAAQPLTWGQYSRLMVDFAMVDAPEQTERRAAIAAAKAQKAADKEKTRRKRGRPRKNKGEE